jgi:competence protein ComEA
MRKPILLLWWLVHYWAATAQVAATPIEINSANLAELEALSGVGTALAARIVAERAKQPFIGWSDAQRRIKGLGPRMAAQLSDQGLTVNGARYVPR